jgi:hypothetical protein
MASDGTRAPLTVYGPEVSGSTSATLLTALARVKSSRSARGGSAAHAHAVLAGVGAHARGPASRRIAGQCAPVELHRPGHDADAAADAPAPAAAVHGLAVRLAVAAGAAPRGVPGHRALVHADRAARDPEPPPGPLTAGGAARINAVGAGGAGRAVPGDGAPVHRDRAARDAEAAPGAAGDVAGHGTLLEAQGATRDVEAASPATRGVPGHGDVVEGHRAAGHGDAAPRRVPGQAVGDRQVPDPDRGGAGDPEDATDLLAADGQGAGPRAVDCNAIDDVQLATGQGDGAGRGEVDCVGSGVGVGGGDGSPQRAGAAVEEVGHREGAGQAAVVECLDEQRRARPLGGASERRDRRSRLQGRE